ncbi:hypothetical protein OsI_09807 [Oryza sativa Indica Group]|uniref:Uncharacterized protein n=1 Tax=Oryza sativa subsp. indica TaxID=39946 RepID=A2XBY9_ORYSI|nr:hypothetical protein OsI_09807 [Oryza sativa Indica Group]
MLQASSELQQQPPAAAAAAGMWVPGMSPQAVDAGLSARAQEIARRREEMLGMLHDLPESEYELSLTDLVEKAGGVGVAPPSPSPSEGKAEPGPARTASGRQSEQQQQAAAAAGRPERRGSARRWDSAGGSSFRSSSDGVLLNFYMPRSFTRSFTAPRTTGPGRPPSVSGGRTASVCSDRNKRERDGETVRCWSLLWDRRWRKSSRGDHGNESAVRAAILKAAKHNASSPKKI